MINEFMRRFESDSPTDLKHDDLPQVLMARKGSAIHSLRNPEGVHNECQIFNKLNDFARLHLMNQAN